MVNRSTGSLISYQAVGGSFVLVCIAGVTVYVNTQRTGQMEGSVLDAIKGVLCRGVSRTIGNFFLGISKKSK